MKFMIVFIISNVISNILQKSLQAPCFLSEIHTLPYFQFQKTGPWQNYCQHQKKFFPVPYQYICSTKANLPYSKAAELRLALL